MSDLIHFIFDFVLHIDKHLVDISTAYNTSTYLILFLIVFCETGLVVTPFLPGDSLLFATGALAALPNSPINPAIAIIVFIVAAFIGDNTNYFIGKYLGVKVYEKEYKLIKREYLIKTQSFYEKHGGKAVIISRFMPIIRTFSPFVAGVGAMKYRKFYSFSILGSLLWVNMFVLAGYYFGNIPIVKRNFTIVVLAIIFISIIPPIYAVIKSKFSKN